MFKIVLLPFLQKNDKLIKNSNKLKRSVVKMVKLIMGLKGSGKTKRLVDLVCTAVNEDNNVVVIENERKLTYDVPYQARLIDAGSYDVGSYEFIKGLISGIHAGNYDITHIFIDNFYKLVGDKSVEALSEFVCWLNRFAESEKLEFVISISAEPEAMPEELKGFII